jgi:NDP-sugar pyrophosphorylase family protein
MKIVIPMTGQGSRFKKAGYDTYKALIRIHGKPVIQHVVELFPGETDFIFICRNDMLESTDLRELLLSLVPTAQVVGIDAHKLGPVYTVSKIYDLIDDNEPVICNYCDFAMVWDYAHFKMEMERTQADGAVICYTGFHPHLVPPENLYATCLADKDQNMLEITEKHNYETDREKGFYSGGTYYFKKGSYIKKYFDELMEKGITVFDEYFISLPFNLMVRDGLKVKVYSEVPFFCQWGSPMDMEQYVNWSHIFEAINSEN